MKCLRTVVGIGFCQCLIAYYVSFYYSVIIGWSIYYLFASFTSQLPWTSCGNHWNTPACVDNYTVPEVELNDSSLILDSNVMNTGVNISNATASMMGVPPALEYFEYVCRFTLYPPCCA